MEPSACCLCFAGAPLMNGAGASLSTRLTSRSERRSPPGSEWEYSSNSDCLPPGMAAWVTQRCWVGGSCGSQWRLIDGVPLWRGPCAVPAGCSLSASFPSEHQSAPTNHTPGVLHSQLPVFKSQFARSLMQALRAIKATAVQFPMENFLPISECVCVCVYLRVSKKTFWFCALSTFEGDMGPYNTEVYNLLS